MDDLRESDETLQLIGIGLMSLQYTEHLLDLCLRLVFCDDESGLLEWETIGVLQGKATLGILLKRLQEKVNVHPDLEAYLGEFLEKRNRFVHRLLEIPEFHLSTGPGHQEVKRFCWDVLLMCINLSRLFMAALRKYQLRMFPDAPMDPELKAQFDDADAWISSVDQLFRVH